MIKQLTTIGLTVLISSCAAYSTSQGVAREASPSESMITANIRSASFVTQDLEKSAAFYKDYMGYKELGRSEVTADKSRQVVGAKGTETVRYLSLVPAEWTKENPAGSGISLVEIPSARGSAYSVDGSRPARTGELILAHRVTNIVEIERRMREGGVTFVAPLGLSGSGKSQSMAVLDLNGNRIEMYEY